MSRRSAILLLALGGALGCGPKLRPDGPDAVLLIVIDTLRADHLGCYGHGAPTSPHLDGLAARGLRFADVTTQVPVTLPSITTILTGRLPFHHGVRDNLAFVLQPSEETLAERFRSARWRTAAVLASSVLARDRGLDQGFEHYDDQFAGEFSVYDQSLAPVRELFNNTQRRANTVTDLALRQIEKFGDDAWFLLVHYFDAHAHYDPPPQHGALFTHPYDGEIHFLDAEIGRLLAGIPASRRLLVAVTADHGESFGEHGEVGHGFLLHQSTLHVPMILAGPGVASGAVRNEPVGLVDLEPTLAELVGLPAAAQPRDGRALGVGAASVEPVDLYAENLRTLMTYNWAPLRALRRGDHKLIAGPNPQWFDLGADPGELSPQALTDSPGAQLDSSLRAWVADDDPYAIRAARQEPQSEQVEALAALGYVGLEDDASATEAHPDPATQLPRWNRRQLQKARLREAQVLLQAERFTEAMAKLDSVLAHDEANVPARHNLGTALWKVGRHEEARRQFVRVLELDPSYLPAARQMAQDFLQRGELARALPLLETLLLEEPANLDHRINLGLCAQRLGRRELAIEHLRGFLERAPVADGRRSAVRDALVQLERGR